MASADLPAIGEPPANLAFTELIGLVRPPPSEPTPTAPVFSSSGSDSQVERRTSSRPVSLHGSSEKALALLDANPSLNKASVLLGETYHVIEQAYEELHAPKPPPSQLNRPTSPCASVESENLRNSLKARTLLDADPTLNKASMILGETYHVIEQANDELHREKPTSPPSSQPSSPRLLEYTESKNIRSSEKARSLLDVDPSTQKASQLLGEPYFIIERARTDAALSAAQSSSPASSPTTEV